MKAEKYFHISQLKNIENALFDDSKEKIRYCLILDSQKFFYIGDSSHITNIVKRMRTTIMNLDSDQMAHNLKKTVRATSMSDWILALPEDDLTDATIVNQLLKKGFVQLHKAKRYEVHGVEDIKCYFLQHRRYKEAQLYMSSVVNLTESLANTRAKKVMRTRSSKYIDKKLTAREREVIISLQNAALHSGTGDWIIAEVEFPHGTSLEVIKNHARKSNEVYATLDYTKGL